MTTDVSAPALLWFPALGVPARKYDRFAAELAAGGIACRVHEWRGTGTHPTRASRSADWGYRDLLQDDIAHELAHWRQANPGRPLLAGGHSIGGQFAVLGAALHGGVDGLVVVGSGVPNWRLFPSPLRWLVAGFGHALPPLTRLVGHYPGEALRFAGREAGQLMRDWAGTVRRGDYDGLAGLPDDLSARLRRVEAPMLGVRLANDRLVPAASLHALFAVTGARSVTERVLDRQVLGVADDHFAWMRSPGAVAAEVARWWADPATRAPLSP